MLCQLLRRQGRAEVGIRTIDSARVRTSAGSRWLLGLPRCLESRLVAPSCLRPRSRRNTWRRCSPISTQASLTRRRPDWTRNSTSRRLNSCLLIDTTATAHLPGPQNPRECHLYIAQGCDLYIALTTTLRVVDGYG